MKAGIDNIEWTVYRKIKGISKTNGVDITYTYDAAGNRISKDVKGQQTWYVRDATGNIMSVYTSKDATVNNGDLTQTETELYGSSRLGMSTLATNVENRPAPVTTNMPGLGEGKNIIFTRGNKLFELSNHLGNVLATVSDEKKPVSLDGTVIDHYEAKITSAQDYYPFGMLMPGRNGHHIAGGWSTGSSVVNGYTVPESLTLGSRAGNQPGDYTASQTINFTEGFNSGVNDAFNAMIADDSYDSGGSSTGDGSNVATGGYRFGFNGKENDNEAKGEGNQQDYGMRIYDPRVGRFLSVDPLTPEYPELTPYQFASNTPIQGIDLDGEEVKIVTSFYATQNSRPLYQVETQFGIATRANMTVIEIHKYRTMDAQGNYHYHPRPTPFIDRENVTPTSTGHGPGQFDYSDGVAGLQRVLNVHGPDMARIVEKMYVSETTTGNPKKYGHGVFTSEQYRNTGTGGMEALLNHEDDPPYYGWAGKDLYERHPEYKPLGINPLFEGPGMSGQGGNKQVKDHPKPFIIFPSVEGAMMYKVEYIQRYNGNWARWGARSSAEQQNYRITVEKNRTRVVDSLMKALEDRVNSKTK